MIRGSVLYLTGQQGSPEAVLGRSNRGTEPRVGDLLRMVSLPYLGGQRRYRVAEVETWFTDGQVRTQDRLDQVTWMPGEVIVWCDEVPLPDGAYPGRRPRAEHGVVFTAGDSDQRLGFTSRGLHPALGGVTYLNSRRFLSTRRAYRALVLEQFLDPAGDPPTGQLADIAWTTAEVAVQLTEISHT